jgi:MATE family multidrug resistance protein
MLTRRQVLALAWPVVLAQAATATTGVVDTAVMGRTGDEVDLAAVAVASVAFSFLYWGFGFLRMATTGLVAQAMGAGEAQEARATLLRGLMLGGALGLALIATYPLWQWAALAAFQAPAAAEEGARGYFLARVPGAPAALMGYAVTGYLLGTGRTRELLLLQVWLNACNAGLDLAFVGLLGWGPAGLGAGTALAEWAALGLGLWLVRDGLRPVAGILERKALLALASVNRDVMIRTLALLLAFAWFVNAGAQLGSATIAGNQVLLQFIAVSAFVLDAFAFIAEKEAGEAVGARDPARLGRAIRVTSELSLAGGAAFALLFLLVGPPVIEAMVADPDARQVALAFLPWCVAVPLLGVPAWQLDGVFLGATQGRALRTAALLASGLYVGTDLLLRPLGNAGVWTAFLAMYAWRALSLAVFLPALLREMRSRPSAS